MSWECKNLVEFQAVSEACRAMFRSTPDLKQKIFDSFGFPAQGTLISMFVVPYLCSGLQSKCLMDHVKDWMSLPWPELLLMAAYRKDWKRISAASSIMSPQRPDRSES